MIKRIILFVLVMACLLVSQVGPGVVQYVTSAPSGSCSANSQEQIVMGTGLVYTCQSGTWTSVGGGGSGTITSSTARYSAYYTGATTVNGYLAAGPDLPPTSANAADDEFNGSSLGVLWTTNNTSGATLTEGTGMFNFAGANNAGTAKLQCIYQAAPATPYTFQTKMFLDWAPTAVGTAGLGFMESATGKFELIGSLISTTDNSEIWVTKWTSTSARSNAVVGNPTTASGSPRYQQISADGTNITLSTSSSGVSYVTAFTEAKAAFFTTAPDRIVLCIDSETGTNTADFDWFRRTQ